MGRNSSLASRSSRCALPTRRYALSLRTYQRGDEAAFVPRADFAEEQAAIGWDWSKGPPGPTWTLVRPNASLLEGYEVLGIGGYAKSFDLHHREAWGAVCDLTPREWAELARLIRPNLDLMFAPKTAVPIYATARADLPGAVRLLQKLGFTAFPVPIVDPRLPDVPLVQMMRTR